MTRTVEKRLKTVNLIDFIKKYSNLSLVTAAVNAANRAKPRKIVAIVVVRVKLSYGKRVSL